MKILVQERTATQKMRGQPAPAAWLVSTNGPPLQPLELKGPAQGITLGRHDQCHVCMPADSEGISRKHARIRWDSGRWLLADLNSSWGTFVNGTRIPADTEVPLTEDDLIGIGVWTLKLSSKPERRVLRSQDDLGSSIVTSNTTPNIRPLAESLLQLLLNGAASIHSARTELELAQQMIAIAQAGTGLREAAFLRPMDASGGIEIIAGSSASSDSGGPRVFSRSLIAAAARGGVAELSRSADEDYGQSIADLNITSAICVSLMLGESPAAFLYLDSRGGAGGAQSLPAQASAFCSALGAIGSLALANLKRMDLEKREAAIRADLNAAAVAQRWIMPQRSIEFGPFVTLGESRPGRFVGGDFFDVVDLGNGRLAVALGDVSGKGLSASVLMTAAQGYLHSSLARHRDPGLAVSDLNRFVVPRRPEDRFLTMWVGVLDMETRTLKYVDAGHGYALRKRGADIVMLNEGNGLPIGIIEEDYASQTVDFRCGDQVVIVSDGFVEQPSPAVMRDEFGMDGVSHTLSQEGEDDPVARLFSSLISFAATDQLADDATAVLVRCVQ